MGRSGATMYKLSCCGRALRQKYGCLHRPTLNEVHTYHDLSSTDKSPTSRNPPPRLSRHHLWGGFRKHHGDRVLARKVNHCTTHTPQYEKYLQYLQVRIANIDSSIYLPFAFYCDSFFICHSSFLYYYYSIVHILSTTSHVFLTSRCVVGDATGSLCSSFVYMSVHPRDPDFQTRDSPYGNSLAQPEPLPLFPTQDAPFQSLAQSKKQYLEAPVHAPFRPLSPDSFSNLSIDEYQTLHNESSKHYPSSISSTWRGKVKTFWTRNLGLFYMLLAQIFGTGMNVATRILEVEGNHGKGFHPFQVALPLVSILSHIINLTRCSLREWPSLSSWHRRTCGIPRLLISHSVCQR